MYQAAVAVFGIRAARSTDNDQVIVCFDGLNTAFRHRCNLTAIVIDKTGTRTIVLLAQVILEEFPVELVNIPIYWREYLLAVCGIEHAARRCVFIAASVNDAIAVELCPFRTVGQNDFGNPFPAAIYVIPFVVLFGKSTAAIMPCILKTERKRDSLFSNGSEDRAISGLWILDDEIIARATDTSVFFRDNLPPLRVADSTTALPGKGIEESIMPLYGPWPSIRIDGNPCSASGIEQSILRIIRCGCAALNISLIAEPQCRFQKLRLSNNLPIAINDSVVFIFPFSSSEYSITLADSIKVGYLSRIDSHDVICSGGFDIKPVLLPACAHATIGVPTLRCPLPH